MLIKRTDSSTYFPADFFDLERKRIESTSPYRYFSPTEALPDQGEIVLITNTHTQLQKWEGLKDRVKLIIHPNSGFENLATQTWSAPVVLGNTIRAQAVAQWCLSALYQEVGFIRHQTIWPVHRFNPRRLPSELKILIVGAGHIGKLLKHHLPQAEVSDPWLGLNVKLEQNWDVVILAASANPKNQNMINHPFLSHCSSELILINPARGELVHKNDLEAFLAAHPKARAYLDVHQQEPYPANFYASSQIMATPHIAGVWDGLIQSMLDFEAETLQHFQQKTIPPEWLLASRRTSEGFYR